MEHFVTGTSPRTAKVRGRFPPRMPIRTRNRPTSGFYTTRQSRHLMYLLSHNTYCLLYITPTSSVRSSYYSHSLTASYCATTLFHTSIRPFGKTYLSGNFSLDSASQYERDLRFHCFSMIVSACVCPRVHTCVCLSQCVCV